MFIKTEISTSKGRGNPCRKVPENEVPTVESLEIATTFFDDGCAFREPEWLRENRAKQFRDFYEGG